MRGWERGWGSDVNAAHIRNLKKIGKRKNLNEKDPIFGFLVDYRKDR